MNILFDINHPGHVHFFKNAIRILSADGHKVVVTARDKEVALQLLRNYGIPHRVLSKAKKGLFGLGMELIQREAQIFSLLRRERIDVCAAITGAALVHAAKLLRIPSLVFYDTEHAKLQNNITIPFATHYFTPDCYLGRRWKNQTVYAGVHELAYLHPKYFTPDPSVLGDLHLKPDEKFVILRFVSWGASHDIGQKGISLELKRELVKKLSPHARIFIVSESPLDQEFEPYRLTLAPEKVHDVMAYAALFIGEGATMASECVCLGTPAIYVNSLKMGYIREEAERYGLLYDLENDPEILQKSLDIVTGDYKEEWREKRQRFLHDKIDVTAFIIDKILENARKT